MVRPRLVVVNADRDDRDRSLNDTGGFRFELSRIKLFFCGLGFVFSLCFMFSVGVLVGRGAPLVSSADSSIKGRFLRFLGLQHETGRPSPNAAATWEDPKKMLETLKYYEDLAGKKTASQDPRARQAPGTAPAQVRQAQNPAAGHRDVESSGEMAANEPVKEGTKRTAAPRGTGKNRTDSAEKPSAAQPEKPRAVENEAGKYTLLVASLKESEAEALIEKLKSKGYSLRVESIDLGASKWSRILLGSFATRETAVEYADEFNRKEKMQALVTSK
jgi:cell division septation protein DedD